MNRCDYKFLNVAKKYGEWPRVLDPVFLPPEQFYVDLEAAGYSREEFDRLRTRESGPERETWITAIAVYLYWAWRHKLDYLDRESFLKIAPGFDNGINWQDIDAFFNGSTVNFGKYSTPFDGHSGVMTRLSITKDDVVRRIIEDPELFPPLVAPPGIVLE